MNSHEVLLNKSGAQTDKQIYYVQSSGALAQGHRPDLALRFDLTVPLARYVARYERHLAFPFRRHQIQRVYRGERQQKGRYREFYQCDIDAIGKNDLPLYHDAEILAVIHEVFEELDLPFSLHLNHRALLYGLVDFFGLRAVQSEILSLLDKTHKKGRGPTIQGLQDIILKDAPTLSPLKREEICGLLTLKAPPEQALSTLNALQIDHPLFLQGLSETQTVLDELKTWDSKVMTSLTIDLSIVRGLDYYTGLIYETFLTAYPDLGSVCSGGRYDNLAQAYTSSRLPGVGISIGASRLFSFLLDQSRIPLSRGTVLVLVARMDPDLRAEYAALARSLRQEGINTAVYSQEVKLSKQIHYANRARIPFVLLLGSRERELQKVTLKTLESGEQQTLTLKEAIHHIQRHAS